MKPCLVPYGWRERAMPTRLELAILGYLWRNGPCKAGRIAMVVASEKKTTRGNVSTMLYLMWRDGLLCRDGTPRRYVYQPAMGRSALIAQVVAVIEGA